MILLKPKRLSRTLVRESLTYKKKVIARDPTPPSGIRNERTLYSRTPHVTSVAPPSFIMEEVYLYLYMECKLRKREESSVSPVTATNVEAATQPSHYHQNSNNSSSNNHHHNHHSSSNNNSSQQHHQQLENGYSVPTPVAFRQSPSSVWVFPPLPPQPNLYSYNANSQDALVHNDKTGFKGLKRQLSGRFKRLVSRKSHEPAPAIPPELKPQLKTIYVY